MTHRVALWVSSIAIALSTAAIRADILTPIASLGGSSVRDVAIIDGHLLIADLGGVSVFDANTTQPPLARIEGPYRYIHEVGSHIWVGDGSNYDVYDVSDPSNPLFVGPLAITPPPKGVYDPATQRYYGLKQNTHFDLSVYDVSSITSPVLVGQKLSAVPITQPSNPDEYRTTQLADLEIEQSRLYIGYWYTYGDRFHWEPLGGAQRVRIFQVSDPSNISLIDEMNLTSWSPLGFDASFAAEGNLLTVISTEGANLPDDSRLICYEIDDVLGASTTGSYPQDLISGPFLKGADKIQYDPTTQTAKLWGKRYYELDLSDPTQIALICDLGPTPGPTVATDGALHATLLSELVDVYAPDCAGLNPTIQLLYGYQASGFQVLGDLLITGVNPATIVDVQDPFAPAMLGKFDAYSSPPNYRELQTIGSTHLVQIGSNDNTIRVFDLSDPYLPTSEVFDAPENVGLRSATSGAHLVFMRYDYDQSETSLQLVDLSDPTAPDFKGSYGRPMTEWPTNATGSVVLYGETAYVSVFDEIWTIDVSKPNAPKLKSTLTASTRGTNAKILLNVAGNLLFSSDYDDPRIFSLADPHNPVQTATLSLSAPLADLIEDVARVGDLVYFWYSTSLYGYDVSDPSLPLQLGTMQSTGGFRVALGTIDSYVVGYLDDELKIMTPTSATATPPASGGNPLRLRSAPNPFAGRAQISWSPALQGSGELRVFDVAGRLLRHWRIGDLRHGSLLWDGRGQDGRRVASGVYYLRLSTGTRSESKRVVYQR